MAEWAEAQQEYARSAVARESEEEVRQPACVASEESVAGSSDEVNVGFAKRQPSEATATRSAERVVGAKVKECEADAAWQVPKKRKTREAVSEEEKEEDGWWSDISHKVRTSSKNRKN